MPISQPVVLTAEHHLSDFDSGEPSLDEWLTRRALSNQSSGASRTYVALDQLRIVGYYCLSSAQVSPTLVPGKFRRNQPDPIPCVLLGRLSVDRRWQGQGIGRALMKDAAQRVCQAAEIIGVRGIVVHALNPSVSKFYQSLGFVFSEACPQILVMTVERIRTSLAV